MQIQVLAKVVLLSALLYTGAAHAEATKEQLSAAELVDRLHETLLDVMKNSEDLGYQGRYDRLQPVVEDSFDFRTIARIVLGRYWKDLGEEQRMTFLETFSKLSTVTYASRFDGYSGELFRHVNEEPLRKGRVLLKTELVKGNGETISFNYILQTKDAKWLIINVIADGVSDLSLKRADYKSVLKSDGFTALVTKLDDKIAKHENKNDN